MMSGYSCNEEILGLKQKECFLLLNVGSNASKQKDPKFISEGKKA